MVTPIAYHSIYSRDDNNLPTCYVMVIASQKDGVLFTDNTYTFSKTKSKLVERIQANGDAVMGIVGDGEVAYSGKTKSFTFAGVNGDVFFAKFEIYKA